MSWLSNNAADLVGHSITVILFVAGFVTLRHEARLSAVADHAMKLYERCAQSIEGSTILMEAIRLELWRTVRLPYDPSESPTEALEQALASVSSLRAKWFGSTLFVPPELRPALRSFERALEELRPAIVTRNLERAQAGDLAVHEAIMAWRSKAEAWSSAEWRRLLEKRSWGVSARNPAETSAT